MGQQLSSCLQRAHSQRSISAETDNWIIDTLDELVADPFQPKLKTHKLKGRLDGLWACSADYDCRIIFLFAPDPEGGEDAIVLIDLGSHDEVY